MYFRYDFDPLRSGWNYYENTGGYVKSYFCGVFLLQPTCKKQIWEKDRSHVPYGQRAEFLWPVWVIQDILIKYHGNLRVLGTAGKCHPLPENKAIIILTSPYWVMMVDFIIPCIRTPWCWVKCVPLRIPWFNGPWKPPKKLEVILEEHVFGDLFKQKMAKNAQKVGQKWPVKNGVRL